MILKQKENVSEPLLCPHIVLRNGKVTLVDQSSMDKLSRYVWFELKSHAKTYIVRRKKIGNRYKYIRLHREITDCPPGMEVHHCNENPYDNRTCNLLPCTPAIHRTFHRKNFIKTSCIADKTTVT